ncbi:O-antigen ligase family protein [Jiella sp. MQZ9-1]|uniref:O-antigen ligase family protein n=1 Tax=Jiella flava TaxID=2816857 RepID=A0A939JUP7_9HYPH|nr:O-antigen ligase [Jiella flava]MBO0661639.1 O-antigen ligase family protein [Jiella flava]MCD2470281.1 O-antigen ligase family protein [Jiella flava]
MSSIGNRNAIDAGSVVDTPDWIGLTRFLLAAAVLSALLVTFTPFAVTFQGSENAGDLTNQLGYSGLAAIVLLGHLIFTERHVLVSLIRPWWVLMIGWLLASALWAPDPQNALRSALFTLLAMSAVTGVFAFPTSGRAFRWVLVVAALAVLGLCYVGVIALPHLAINDGSGSEPEHAGLWRGIYSHKNIAGAVIGSLFFFGVYLLRSRMIWIGLSICALAANFVLHTGSKTSTGLLPLVTLLVIFGRIVGGRRLLAVGVFLAIVAMALLTLGTVLSPTLDAIVQWAAPGTTYTGRMDLWRYALEVWQGHHWTGFGLNAFWQTDVVAHTEKNFELSWDPRGSPNAHNGYLDIAISMGIPGLFLAVVMLVILPLVDYARIGRDPESTRLGDTLLMVLFYLLLNSFLESYLFERANPIWMLVWFAVVGLRLLARHRMESGVPG